MTKSFNKSNFKTHCNALAKEHIYFNDILLKHSYPLLFTRSASFETLVQIILEQQVSLASARAAYIKLQEKIKEVTPEAILQLTPEELRACYFTRQKIVYVKHLAQAVVDGSLNIKFLIRLTNDEVRVELKKIKGIGNWTADVFLMMALHRCDCFPLGDVALITSAKEVLSLPKETTKQEIELITNNWKPYRTIAAFMLWWAYIKKRNIKL